jgi:hypothetical protein
MIILDNCWWKYVYYVLVEICFYRNMFRCIFISVKYVSSISNILDTFYISIVSNISFVLREYYVLRCYKHDVVNHPIQIDCMNQDSSKKCLYLAFKRKILKRLSTSSFKIVH